MLQAKQAPTPYDALDVNFCYADCWCGKFRLILERDGSVGIWNVNIEYQYRGIGLGTQMMKECVEFIREKYPNSRIFLYVEITNESAKKVYKKVGFKFTDFFIRGDTAVRMEMQS